MRFLNFVSSLLLVAGLGLTAAALANAPTVGIATPLNDSVVEVASFPATVSVTANVGHSPLSALKQLMAADSQPSVLFDVNSDGAGNPFGDGTCATLSNNAAVVHTCSLTGSPPNSASVGFDWTVPAEGTYTLTVSGKHGNDTGSASVTVTFILAATGDHPAPPAVANAYLRANYPNLTRGVHGCIIQAIAHGHAADVYGPEGGPYDIDAIHADVELYLIECSAG